jgi:hypothetical protein
MLKGCVLSCIANLLHPKMLLFYFLNNPSRFLTLSVCLSQMPKFSRSDRNMSGCPKIESVKLTAGYPDQVWIG